MKNWLSQLARAVERWRYRADESGYDAARYWRDRLRRHGPESLRGVGHRGLSEEANRRQYAEAGEIFDHTVRSFELPAEARVLEIGYGTGFYTRRLHALGFRDYLGVDLADGHRQRLRAELAGFSGRLDCLDAGREAIDWPGCGLAVMIDVAYHIVDEEAFGFCLHRNVAANLAPGGVLLATDSLVDRRVSFYERERSLDGWIVASGLEPALEPRPFRNKLLFGLRRPLAPPRA